MDKRLSLKEWYAAHSKQSSGKQKFAKAAWMRKYEELVVKQNPELRGKIDWDTATYLFGTGISPEEAASKGNKGKAKSPFESGKGMFVKEDKTLKTFSSSMFIKEGCGKKKPVMEEDDTEEEDDEEYNEDDSDMEDGEGYCDCDAECDCESSDEDEEGMEDEEDLTEARKTKRAYRIRVNAKGQRKRRRICGPGKKAQGNRCVPVKSREKLIKKRAARKLKRTLSRKGKGFFNRKRIKAKRALRKRRGMGL